MYKGYILQSCIVSIYIYINKQELSKDGSVFTYLSIKKMRKIMLTKKGKYCD